MHLKEEDAFVVRHMEPSDVKAVSELHCTGIPTGLLADLGVDVLSSLYSEIAHGDNGFVYVLIDKRKKIKGFIAGATRLDKIMRGFIIRKLFRLGFITLKLVFSKASIVRIRDNIRYSSKQQIRVPVAELLSIVVDPSLRGTGAAELLLNALKGEFSRQNVSAFKVMVRADFDRANAFYQKNGFEHSQMIKKGGHLANIYVSDVLTDAMELSSE